MGYSISTAEEEAPKGDTLPPLAFFIDFTSLSPPSEPPQIVRTAQKGTYVGKHEVLSGEASRQRRLSSFEQDALMVVEVDIAVNHLVGFRESSWFVAVNALCLED